MFDVVKEIADAYFVSEEYEDYAKKNKTNEDVDELRTDLIEKFGKDAEEEISSSLYAAHNLCEYNGLIQGINRPEAYSRMSIKHTKGLNTPAA